jgi:hypothetical protein
MNLAENEISCPPLKNRWLVFNAKKDLESLDKL